MTEDALRDIVRRAFRSKAVFPWPHLSWIESHATASGFPDLELCYKGRSTQVELKIVKDDGKIVIRPSQYRWFKDRVKAQGDACMWVGSDHGHFIVPGHSVEFVRHVSDLRSGVVDCKMFLEAQDAACHILGA